MQRAETAVLGKLRSVLAAALVSPEANALTFSDDPPRSFAIERGVAWPVQDHGTGSAAFGWMEPLLREECDLDDVDVIDRAGHRRAVYKGLLAYAMFQAIRVSDRVLLDAPAEVAVRHIETLQGEVSAKVTTMGSGGLPAAAGDAVAALAWQALALFAGGELLDDDRSLQSARRAMRAIGSRQSSAGGYLTPSKSDNPETLWLHELQILHALASYGLQTGDADLLASAARAAGYHLNETQPDHATNQPWGLPAFMIDPQTHIMADAMLHAAAVEQPEGLSGVTLILLADALYSWRRR